MTEIKKRGGFRGGVKPTLPPEKRRKTYSFRFPPELVEEVKKHGSITQIIEQQLNEYLAKRIDK